MRMAAEEHDGGRAPSVNPTEGDHPLDEVAKSLATGTVSRRQAVRWMGGALLGSVLAIVPGVEAFAAPKPAKGRCPTGFVNCRGTCVKTQSNSSHCGGCFIQCSQNETCCGGQCSDLCSDSSNCGFCGNTCPEGRVCQGCGCVCQSGTVECGGECVSDSCPEGQIINPSTCQCECPSNTNCPFGQTLNPITCQCECPPLAACVTCTCEDDTTGVSQSICNISDSCDTLPDCSTLCPPGTTHTGGGTNCSGHLFCLEISGTGTICQEAEGCT